MKAKDFINYLYDNLKVNSPAYRGASITYNEEMINETNFEDDLRFKSVDFDIIDNYTLQITWESQLWNDNQTTFFEEIRRVCELHAKKCKLEEEAIIFIKLFDRDGTAHVTKNIIIS